MITILICVGIFTLVFSVYLLTLHGGWSYFQPIGACFNLLRLYNPLKLRRRLLMKHERIVCYFLLFPVYFSLFPVYIVYIGNCTLFCFTTIYCFVQTRHGFTGNWFYMQFYVHVMHNYSPLLANWSAICLQNTNDYLICIWYIYILSCYI